MIYIKKFHLIERPSIDGPVNLENYAQEIRHACLAAINGNVAVYVFPKHFYVMHTEKSDWDESVERTNGVVAFCLNLRKYTNVKHGGLSSIPVYLSGSESIYININDFLKEALNHFFGTSGDSIDSDSR